MLAGYATSDEALMSQRALRSLLRAVDKYITRASGNQLWRNYVLDQFHLHKDSSDPSKTEYLVSCAEEYAELVHAVHDYKKLLESYNITTDKDAQQRAMVEKTAKRVGLKLPESKQ